MHVVYFWKDLRSSFREIARVLKPGAKLALVFRSTEHTVAVQSFPAEVYRFPAIADVEAALEQAGFTSAFAQAQAGAANASPHLLIAMRTADHV